MPVSIRDVAEQAQVSVSTVSKALNDVPARIPAETRENIRRIARALGYSPNRIARSLGRRRSDTIGVMIAGLRNPFFADLAESAEVALRERGYQVLLETTPPSSTSHEEQSKLRGWPVDGVLVWSASYQSLSDYLGTQADTPPAVYLGYLRPSDPASDAVATDLYAGGALLAEHLLERGYGFRRGVACLTYEDDALHDSPQETREVHLRTQGFYEVSLRHGVAVERILLSNQAETREVGYRIGQEIAARPEALRPEALFCHNDIIAVGVYRALRRAGLRVPEEIAVAGFDGIDEGMYLDDPLTTVVIPTQTLCQTAVDLLMGRMKRPDAPSTDDTEITLPGRQILIAPTLRVGGTT